MTTENMPVPLHDITFDANDEEWPNDLIRTMTTQYIVGHASLDNIASANNVSIISLRAFARANNWKAKREARIAEFNDDVAASVKHTKAMAVQKNTARIIATIDALSSAIDLFIEQRRNPDSNAPMLDTKQIASITNSLSVLSSINDKLEKAIQPKETQSVKELHLHTHNHAAFIPDPKSMIKTINVAHTSDFSAPVKLNDYDPLESE